MANEQNLRPGEYKLTLEEQKKGGIASGAARRARKTLREELLILLAEPISDKKGNTKTCQEALAAAMIKQGLLGKSKAFEIIRDTIGEKPVEKVMFAEVEQSVIDEVEAAVLGNGPETSD